MKKLNFILVAFAFSFGVGIVNAQVLIPDENDKGKFGYTNENGDKVINYDFKEAYPFVDGKAKVRKGDKWGYINTSGKEVIKIMYTDMNEWENGVCKVGVGGSMKDGELKGAKYGYINEDGSYALKPEFSEIGIFKDGLARVQKGGKYGYIDKSLKIIVPCNFKFIGTFNKDGYVWVSASGKMDKANNVWGKLGIYDRTGRCLIPPKHKRIGVFNKASGDDATYYPWTLHAALKNFCELESSANNYFLFDNAMKKATSEARPALVDANGNILIKAGLYNNIYCPFEGFATVTSDVSKKDVYINVLNVATGTSIYPKDLLYKKADYPNGSLMFFNFCEGTARVVWGKKYYMIDKSGAHITQDYDSISPFVNKNVTVICNDGRYGLMNRAGKTIVPLKYDKLIVGTDNYFGALKNEKCGFIDATGEVKIPFNYINILPYAFNWAFVKTTDGWGIIDRNNNSIVDTKWEDMIRLSGENQKYVWVKNDKNNWHCWNIAKRQMQFEQGYTDATNFNENNVAYVLNADSKFGCINDMNEIIIPFEIDSVDLIKSAYKSMKDANKSNWNNFDTYRFNIYASGKCNTYMLNNQIPDNMWDF